MGVRAQCKCIIKLDAEAKLPRLVCVCVLFFSGIFAGVSGEISERARSDCLACHFED